MYSALLGGILGLATWYILMNLSGNRPTRTMAPADRAALLAEPPPSGSAIVYVARQVFSGGMAGFDIVLDGEQVAQLKSPQSTRLIVAPDAHTLSPDRAVSPARKIARRNSISPSLRTKRRCSSFA